MAVFIDSVLLHPLSTLPRPSRRPWQRFIFTLCQPTLFQIEQKTPLSLRGHGQSPPPSSAVLRRLFLSFSALRCPFPSVCILLRPPPFPSCPQLSPVVPIRTPSSPVVLRCPILSPVVLLVPRFPPSSSFVPRCLSSFSAVPVVPIYPPSSPFRPLSYPVVSRHLPPSFLVLQRSPPSFFRPPPSSAALRRSLSSFNRLPLTYPVIMHAISTSPSFTSSLSCASSQDLPAISLRRLPQLWSQRQRLRLRTRRREQWRRPRRRERR